MKAVVNDKCLEPKSIPYPCILKADSGMIVLMKEYGKGTVIANPVLSPIGSYHDEWPMANFKIFTGTIELSND